MHNIWPETDAIASLVYSMQPEQKITEKELNERSQ